MRTLICVLIAMPFGVCGQTSPGQTSGTCAAPFEAAATPGREIAMNLRSGDITIAATDAPVVRVSCTARDSPGDIRISFAANHLTIRGGPKSDVRFRIEVPRSTGLVVRCSAGDLIISGVSGD